MCGSRRVSRGMAPARVPPEALMIRLPWLSLVAASLLACGGSAENTSTSSGSGSSTGQGGATASSTGSAGSGTGAGGGACDVPPDEHGPDVTVRLVNHTGQDLYLGNPTQGG